MSVFAKSKKHLTILGIRIVSEQTLPEFLQDFQLTVNRVQISCVIFLFGTYIFSVLYTLIFKAIEFSEISEALTYFVIGIVHSSFLSISIWKRPQIMAFIDDMDDVIEKSVGKKDLNIFDTWKAAFNFFFCRKKTSSDLQRL